MKAPRAIALCQCFNGALEFQAGNWGTATAALNESIHLHRELGAASGEALAWQRLGVVQSAQGHLDEAMRSFEEGIAAAERATMRAHCLARLYASMTRNRLLANDLDAADQYLALGLSMGQRHGNCSTCDALLLPAAVSVCIEHADFETAENYCLQLDEAANNYGSRTWIAMAHQARGELATALGNFEEALSYYSRAYDGYQAAGYQYEAARCLQATASIRHHRGAEGDEKIAQQVQREATRMFDRLTAA
jgi:tetratricopeptide (TPR) repeat protein